MTAVVAGRSEAQRPLGAFRTSSFPIASPTHSGHVLPLSLPRSFHDSPEQQAVNGFFVNYVLIRRHPYSRRGYLDCLLPLYQNARDDSLLSLATTAMALAIEGGSPSTAHYRKLSHSFFGRALVKTSRAIRDPIESVKDETLMSVLLLSFYEVCIPLILLHYPCWSLTIRRVTSFCFLDYNGVSSMFRGQL